MRSIIPSQEVDISKPFAGLDIALFFQKELRELVDTYGYSEKEYQKFLSWHQPGELVEKIIDPDRFFRIIRDTDGKMVGFFESKGTVKNHQREETVQWIFIAPSEQRKGYAQRLWEEFFVYCREKGVKKVASFTVNNNTKSIQMHEKMGFQKKGEKDGEITFEKILG